MYFSQILDNNEMNQNRFIIQYTFACSHSTQTRNLIITHRKLNELLVSVSAFISERSFLYSPAEIITWQNLLSSQKKSSYEGGRRASRYVLKFMIVLISARVQTAQCASLCSCVGCRYILMFSLFIFAFRTKFSKTLIKVSGSSL
jgi:hypothetical protein